MKIRKLDENYMSPTRVESRQGRESGERKDCSKGDGTMIFGEGVLLSEPTWFRNAPRNIPIYKNVEA